MNRDMLAASSLLVDLPSKYDWSITNWEQAGLLRRSSDLINHRLRGHGHRVIGLHLAL